MMTIQAHPFFRSKPLTEDEQAVAEAYRVVGRSLDDLPYTKDFDRLVRLARKSSPQLDEAETFRRLSNLRTRGRLPLFESDGAKPLPMSEWEREMLQDLLFQTLESSGQRDRLPYSQHFEGLQKAFNEMTGRDLSAHDVWRLIARISK